MELAADIWVAARTCTYTNEASVEHLLILPLLEALGYEREDISPKHPVIFHEGRKGRPHEADFVVFDGPIHNRDTSLLVVEAKSPTEALPQAKEQAESYAMWLRAPLYMVTNGNSIAVWQLQTSFESKLLLDIKARKLAEHRGRFEQILAKAALRSYCQSLRLKNIAIHARSTRNYEEAELGRVTRSVYTVSRSLHPPAKPGDLFSSSQLLERFPRGAIIIAPSGYGKTTLAMQVLEQGIRLRQEGSRSSLPFEASLPDVVYGKSTPLDFLVERIEAHSPSVTRASLLDIFRTDGLTLLCDGYDRVDNSERRKVEVGLKSLLRDFTLAQLFVFTRPGSIPNLELPLLSLAELKPEEQVEMAKLHGKRTSAESLLSYRWLTPFLKRLAAHPLLLQLILDVCMEKRKPPRDILTLFEAWLQRALCMSDVDIETQAERERGLRLIAQATVDAPISKINGLSLFRREGVAGSVLEDLVRCDAVSVRGSQLEVVHEALADYLRATDLAALPDDSQVLSLDTVRIKQGAMLPVLLAAALGSREGQRRLWDKIRASGLQEYLSALHYRGDASHDIAALEEHEATQAFLTDMLDGVELLLSQYFPGIRQDVISELAHEPCQLIATRGVLVDGMRTLYSSYESRLASEPRVRVEKPPEGRRIFRDIAASRLRADSGLLLGALDVKEALRRLISEQRLPGGKLWRHERLIGDLRYVERVANIHICEMPLVAIRDILRALAGLEIPRTLRSSGRVIIDEDLCIIDELLDDGKQSLDLWWQPTELEQADSTGIAHCTRYVREHFRRLQLVYRELVTRSFADVAPHMLPHFAILPIRYMLTVVINEEMGRTKRTLHYDWKPVERWEDCGAEVTVAESPPTTFGTKRIDEFKANLRKLGRNAEPFITWHSGGLPDTSGYHLSCNFDGLTSVAREATEWLEEDLHVLFDGLRES